jgi:hypothetical protein
MLGRIFRPNPQNDKKRNAEYAEYSGSTQLGTVLDTLSNDVERRAFGLLQEIMERGLVELAQCSRGEIQTRERQGGSLRLHYSEAACGCAL